ncbi:MAG: hypothetical protein QOH17_3513 [Pseudonocardiales bacterium]|nr:hypothetical protein [Pseudonocardiales bacterium]
MSTSGAVATVAIASRSSLNASDNGAGLSSAPKRSRMDLVNIASSFFTGLPDVSVTMEDLVIPGDRVVGRFVYRGTHSGNFVGIPASGSPIEMRSIDIWRVQNACSSSTGTS